MNKTFFYRALAVVAISLSMNSCFSARQMYQIFGFMPVHGSLFSGNLIGGCLTVSDFGVGRQVASFTTDDLPGQAGTYTGAFDGFSTDLNYTSQVPFRLGAGYEDVELRDIGADGNGNYVGVGTGGSIYSLDAEDCLVPRISGTTENLNSVAHSHVLDRWFIGGDNGTILSSRDGNSWSSVPNGNPPVGTDFLDVVPYPQGAALMAGGRIAEVTEGPNNDLKLGYAVGFKKSFYDLAPLKYGYLALAVDVDSGGTVPLERTASSFDYAPRYGGIFSSSYSAISSYGDYVYFIREDSGPNHASVVEVRSDASGEIINEVQLPITPSEFHFFDNTAYFSGINPWHELHVYKANLNFSSVTGLTGESVEREIKSGECLDSSKGPTWSIVGDDFSPSTDGIQFERYQLGESWSDTVIGTSGTGCIQATYRVGPRLALGVGWDGAGSLFFADEGSSALKLGGSGLSGALNGIEGQPGIKLITNVAGKVFSATPPANPDVDDYTNLEWSKESLAWDVNGSISTAGLGRFYYGTKDGGGTPNEISVRETDGSWSSLEVDFTDEITDVHYQLGLLYVASSDGLGTISDDGTQSLLPVEINGNSDLTCHKILGDGAGDNLYGIFGDQEDPDGRCAAVRLNFNGDLMATPSVDVLGYVTPELEPNLGESAGFFVLMGNRNLFSLAPQPSDWGDYAERNYGDRNVARGGDINSNGVSNYEEALAGPRGLQAHVRNLNNGLIEVHLPHFPMLQDHTITPMVSDGLDGFMDHDGPVFVDPTGDFVVIDELQDSRFYQFRFELNF